MKEVTEIRYDRRCKERLIVNIRDVYGWTPEYAYQWLYRYDMDKDKYFIFYRYYLDKSGKKHKIQKWINGRWQYLKKSH